MSESSDDDFAPAAAKASNSSKCLDLTLVDTDEDEPPTHKGGSYSNFGRYATSMRKRERAIQKRPAPKVVTPRAKKKRSSSGGGNNRASSGASSGDDGVPVGAVGYSFHKRWTFDKGEGTPKVEKWIHGEVVAILDNSWVVDGGRDRRCVYADGDVQDHSLEELSPSKGPSRTRVLAPVRRCTNNSCIMKRGLQEAIASAKDDGLLEEEVGGQVEGSPVSCVSDSKPSSSSPEDLPALLEGSAATSDSMLEVSGDGYEASSPSGTSIQNSSDDNEGATDVPMEGDKVQTNHVDANDDSEGSDLFASDDDNDEAEMPSQHSDRVAEKSDNKSDDSAGSDLFESDDDANEDEGKAQTRDVWGRNRNPFADDDDASTASRFSDVDPNFAAPQAPPIIKLEPIVKLKKKEKATSLVTDFVTPPVVRMEPDCYYFAVQWGHRMQVQASPSGDGPPPSHFNYLGNKYEILFSELVARKGKGKVSEDRMGMKYYKSYYIAVSGPGMEPMDLKSSLQSIGDFEHLTYEKGAHKALSRLKLLVSPSCRSLDNDRLFMMHRLADSRFEIIEDNGHLGCGFVPKSLLVELLGKGAGAQRAFAIQVRIIGPSRLGVAKGMLVVKADITKIQVPASMLKVNKSNTRPLHTDVVLNIHHIYPSTNHEAMGRLVNDELNDPPFSMLRDLKPPCDDVLRVLECKGVPGETLEQYMREFNDVKHMIDTACGEQKGTSKMAFRARVQDYTDELKERNAIKHANVVGVIDPTGAIPRGHVFLTGMGHLSPPRVLVTRNPCTTGKDGIVVPVASWRDMPDESFLSLSQIGFGAVVFPLEDELPAKINDGDLDGDNYVCIWDERIVGSVHTAPPATRGNSPVFKDDDLVESSFLYDIDGDLHDTVVVQKIGEDPDTYNVETGPNGDRRIVQMTRKDIYEVTDYITTVVGDTTSTKAERSSKGKSSKIQFECAFATGKSEWLSIKDIQQMHSGPPEALVDYVQQQNLLKCGRLSVGFIKWIKSYSFGEVEMKEIVNHRTKDGKVEVLCQYNDGEEIWLPIDDAKADCKFFLGSYAKSRKNALRRPEWEGVDHYWLEEVQDLMCKQRRSNDINRLVSTLHGRLKGASRELGCDHPETESWGDAYKEALDIEKHGGKLKLPFHLYRQLPEKLQRFVSKERD